MHRAMRALQSAWSALGPVVHTCYSKKKKVKFLRKHSDSMYAFKVFSKQKFPESKRIFKKEM